MSTQDFRQYLQKQPFLPFKVFLSDGSTYEIRHPEMAVPGFTAVLIAVYPAGSSEVQPEDTVLASMQHITRLEYLHR